MYIKQVKAKIKANIKAKKRYIKQVMKLLSWAAIPGMDTWEIQNPHQCIKYHLKQQRY